MNANSVLNVDDLTCILGESMILSEVSFSLRAGETLGIIGPNGSGKTTLMNCLSGFLPLHSGSVRFQNSDITRLPPHERARLGIGRVFQNPGIFRELSVEDNLMLALESRQSWREWLSSKAKNTRRAQVLALLEEVSLKSKRKQNAAELSGGQMRLLEIVRAFAFGAEVFLLDEPTAGVAPILKNEVGRLLRMLQQKGKSLVIIEHDMRFIAEYCERLIVLETGKVALEGAVDEVQSSQKLREIYLGKV